MIAQNYLGLSANIGNQLSFSPNKEGFKRPVSISGSLVYLNRENLKNEWVIDTELGIGILGYNLFVVGLDTLSNGWDLNTPSYFYETFYGQASLSIGKQFILFKKTFVAGLGGGLSYYLHTNAPSQYGMGIDGDEVFYSSTSSDNSALAGFGRMYVQMKLGFRFVISLSYIYHFNPAIRGTYEFYHTNSDFTGEFRLYQRELRFSVLYVLNLKKG